jgi:hypothetical protein
MDILIYDFYNDLFTSFKFNKIQIDEQLDRDFRRLSFYFCQKKIDSKNNFYYLLNSLPYSRIIKRLLWVIPNQATLYPFYHFLQQKFGDKIIAELPHNNKLSNDFVICIDPLNNNQLQIKMFKNFRVVENVNFNIIDKGYITMEIQFQLGNDMDKHVHMKYELFPVDEQHRKI